MKIAIFSDTFFPQINGVASVARLSAKALSDLGHEVTVFTAVKPTHQKISSEKAGVRVVNIPSLPFPGYPGERAALPFGTSLGAMFRFRPDVIHVHTPMAVGWEAVIAGMLLGVPVVGTHHTFYDHYLRYVKMDFDWAKKASWKYTAAYYNRCDMILSPSEALIETMRGQGLTRPARVMPNPIDTELFHPLKDAAKKKKLKAKYGIPGLSLVYMGRVGYEKNIPKLLEAFAILAKSRPELKLMIVGDGPDRPQMERLAEELKIKNSTIFTGFLHNEELVDALWANDIFVTASKSENMPISVLEALSAGLPAVGVDALGIPEIIKDGQNGFIAGVDDPRDMAGKLQKLLDNAALRRKFAGRSRAIALDYSARRAAEFLEGAYKEVIKPKQT